MLTWRERATSGLLVLGLFGLCAALGAIITWLPNPTEAVGVCIALLIAPSMLIAGLARFDVFVIMLLLVRISLDGLKSGESTSGGGSVSLAVGGLFIFVGALYLVGNQRAVRMSPFTRALYFFSFAAFASMAVSQHVGTAASNASKVLAGAMMFDVLEQIMARKPEAARRIVLAALASSIIPIALALQQAATHSGNGHTEGFNRVFGTAVTPTSLATYLLPILALLIAMLAHRQTPPWLRVRCLYLLPFPLVVLYFTYTRSAWLMLIFGIIYILWYLRRNWLTPFVLLLAAFVVLTPGVGKRFSDLASGSHSRISETASANSLDWRFGYWKEAEMLVKGDQVLTGIGIGVTQVEEPSHLPPHNIAVQAYTEMGILGALAGIMVIFAFRRTVRRRRELAKDWRAQVLAIATGATGLMVLGEGMAANVLTQTIVYWYCAGVLAWGLWTTTTPAISQETIKSSGGSGDSDWSLPWLSASRRSTDAA